MPPFPVSLSSTIVSSLQKDHLSDADPRATTHHLTPSRMGITSKSPPLSFHSSPPSRFDWRGTGPRDRGRKQMPVRHEDVRPTVGDSNGQKRLARGVQIRRVFLKRPSTAPGRAADTPSRGLAKTRRIRRRQCVVRRADGLTAFFFQPKVLYREIGCV